MKYYSGIGSRETPSHVLKRMSSIAHILQNDYTLRSGGAQGADTAFESGITNDNKCIYLPWKNFNKNTSPLYNISEKAFNLAEKYHPSWKSLTYPARKLHARNVYQVLGEDLETPSDFVLCWTRDGCETFLERSKKTGGTGSAITIASYHDIPVINMFNSDWFERFIQTLENISGI